MLLGVKSVVKFSDIEPYTAYGRYRIDVPLKDLDRIIAKYISEYKLDLDPDFQRGHVWKDEQRRKYVEYILRRGQANREILFNCQNWLSGEDELVNFCIVDGKQRLNSCLRFVNNDLKVFGCYYKDFEDKLRSDVGLIFRVNDLSSRLKVLKWYLEINSNCTPHTQEELEKVQSLIKKEKLS